MDHLLVPPTNSKDEEPTPHRASPRARAPLRSEAHASSAPSDELQVACLMGLVSALSATPEVLRVSPYHAPSVVNAVGASVTESATNDISQTPLRKAGIDGSGEVVQVVDTGLDETSCFFVDEDGGEVEHGYFFRDLISAYGYYYSWDDLSYTEGNFPVDMDRRKVVQYIAGVKSEASMSSSYHESGFHESTVFPGDFTTSSSPGPMPEKSSSTRSPSYSSKDDGSSDHGSSGQDVASTGHSIGSYYSSYYYSSYSWINVPGFDEDTYRGHGTHVAGSVAGATLSTPATTAVCSGTDHLSCVGACLNATWVKTLVENYHTDWDTWCETYNCDGSGDETCLGKDVGTTLAENGGIARGAKLAIFDASDDGYSIHAFYAGNGLWESSNGTGARVHTNSWGSYGLCYGDAMSTLYDTYMHENPENLLIFAAGNSGVYDEPCTILTPAIGKNVLTVGASSSGPERMTYTGADGSSYTDIYGFADIDMVAYFSSYGPALDGRIKPEVLAPGDQVISASSDGTDDLSCEVTGFAGTSMATPFVAGAAAMVRQYFKDESFYAADVKQRGHCADSASVDTASFICDPFSPNAATVKAMLVNSANLMNGSTEPDGHRGFGRVHLETTMPLNGEGDRALFVADSSTTTLEGYQGHKYFFDLVPNTGIELRATLAWNDPPASSLSPVLLIHDLNLKVMSPDGTIYRMWSDRDDDRNVIERVIVSESDIATDGRWTVMVSSLGLIHDDQSYSLVVTGPFKSA